MKRLILSMVLVVLVSAAPALADVLLAWDFHGLGGQSSVAAQVVEPGVANSVAAIGPGLTAMNYLSNGLTARNETTETLAAALAGNKYFTWTVAPEAGYVLNLDRFEIRPVSQDITRTFVLFSSVDGFAEGAEFASFGFHGNMGPATPVVVDLDGFENLTEPVEFRMYVYHDPGASWNGWMAVGMGNVAGDDLAVHGTVVPEPASLALLGLGGIAMLRRRR